MAKVKKEEKVQTQQADAGEVNHDLVSQLNEILKWMEQREVINKNISKSIANIKKTYNIPAYATRYEIRMRKMNPETRTEVERNIDSIRKATGVNYSLDLVQDVRQKPQVIAQTANPDDNAIKMAMAH